MTFEVGQKVVYPNHGVAVIEDVSEAEFDGMEHNFYHLRLLSNNSKVMIPKENLDLVGLRPLGTASEIKDLFGILEDGNIDTYKDWKGRYKQNLDKMKTGQLTEVAEVLKNLCLVSQKKSLSFREKKMYERAKYFIVSEIAHVRELAEDDAETAVEDALERSLEKMRAEAADDSGKKAKSKSKSAPKSKSTKDDKDSSGGKDASGGKGKSSSSKSSSSKSSSSKSSSSSSTKKSSSSKASSSKASTKKAGAKKSTAKKSTAKSKASKSKSVKSETAAATAS